MKEFGIVILTALACIGICLVLGICSRQTEKHEKDRDSVVHTLGRGFGVFILISTGISILMSIIYLLRGCS